MLRTSTWTTRTQTIPRSATHEGRHALRLAVEEGEAGQRRNLMGEISAGLGKPALLVHGGGLVLLWAGVVVAVGEGRVPRCPSRCLEQRWYTARASSRRPKR